MVLLIGLAVGVDYSMFYLKRERAGTGRGAQRAGRARGRRRDLRPLGARLRPDRDRGDGRHVPDGRLDLRVVRLRDDPRRRRRGARLADRASRTALEARRPGRPARVPLVGRLRRDDGEGRIWGAIVDRVLRRPLLSAVLAGGLLLALAAPALQLRLATPGPGVVPEVARRHQDVRADAAGVPGHGAPGERRRPGAERERTGGAGGDRPSSSSGRSRAANAFEPITVDVNRTRRSRTSPSRSPGTGTDPASNAAFRMLRDEIVPETVGALPDTEAGVTGHDAPMEGPGRRR